MSKLSEFMDAAKNGDLRNLLKIYQSGEINDIDAVLGNYTALERAVNNNRLECVEYLLDIGCDKYTDNGFCIRAASEQGYFNILELLLENSEYSKSVIEKSVELASKHGHKNVVQLINDYSNNSITYKDPNKWAKIDAKTISNSKRDRLTKIKIDTIFNFLSSKRTTVTTTNKNEVIEIEKFSEIEDKEELILAHDKLVEEGGTPDKNKIFTNPFANKTGKTNLDLVR